MKFDNIIKGEGPKVILLYKEGGQYRIYTEGDSVLEILQKIIPLYKKSAEDNGTTLEELLKLK